MIYDELQFEADGEVQAIVTSKEMSISPEGSAIAACKKWEQVAVDSAAESPTPDVEAIDPLPGKARS